MSMRSLCLFAALLGSTALAEHLRASNHQEAVAALEQPAYTSKWPKVVDSAVYRSVDNEEHSADVTKTVNRLIGKFGFKNFTTGRSFNEVFGDPAFDEWKMLRISKGDKTIDVMENDSQNGGPADTTYDLSELSD